MTPRALQRRSSRYHTPNRPETGASQTASWVYQDKNDFYHFDSPWGWPAPIGALGMEALILTQVHTNTAYGWPAPEMTLTA